MGLLLTLIAGLALWIVLWGTSLMKSFDAFLIAMLLVLLAATFHLLTPHLPGAKD
jgi:Mn2+/Fe2+ NRAMP family transporter